MIEEIVDLLKRLPRGLNSSDDEKLRTLLKRLMTIQNTSGNNLYAPAEVGTDSDKLDGQHGGFYQDASNLNAGTLNTDRFSAYTDLGAESKIGAGATQVAAGNHAHAGLIQNPMTTVGDMIYQPGSYTVANADATGNKVVNANPSSAEKIIPVCDLKIADPVGNITITWDAWASMNQTGVVKKVTVRLRRDDLNGAILWSLEKQMATDSVLGHDQQFNGSLIDTAVTTGRYVLTSTATGASVVDIYGDTRTFTIAGYTNTPSRLPIGTVAGHVLSVNAGATAPEWSNRGVTNGDAHDHNGGDGAQINHTTLSSIGTNNHAAIDTFIASKGQASGLASLNAGSKVVEDPANATGTPTANKIPIADANGYVDGWVRPYRGRTFSEDFAANLPAGWSWAASPFVTPPTVTLIDNTILRLTGYTAISRSFLNKAVTTNRNYYLLCPIYRLAATNYIGWRIDDGTDNNYIEYYHSPQSDGSFSLLKKTRTGGGAPVETSMKNYAMPLPWITLYPFINGTQWSDWYVDFYLLGSGIPFMSMGTTGTPHFTFTPTRAGFVLSVSAANYLYADIDAWTNA